MENQQKLALIVPTELAGQRLDVALSTLLPQFSRARLQRWIKQGNIVLGTTEIRRPRDIVKGGEHVHVNVEAQLEVGLQPEAISLNVVHEDDELLIINKPFGLVVHPGAGNLVGTLAHGLLHYLPALQNIPRAGIVHRLDKNTSGLMVVAKTLSAQNYLVKHIQSRSVKREYLAIVHGIVISGGTINASIGRHVTDRTRMAIVVAGKTAITHYRVAERAPGFTLLKVTLHTGRTHQIRVHLSSIEHHVVGDPVYGMRTRQKKISDQMYQLIREFKRQALHAYRLQLMHPVTGEDCVWEITMPDDMQQLWSALKNNS